MITTINIQEVIDIIRKNEATNDTISGVFGLSDERYKDTTFSKEELMRIVDEPKSKTEVFARMLESVQTQAENSAEALHMIYRLISAAEKGALIGSLKKAAVMSMLEDL